MSPPRVAVIGGTGPTGTAVVQVLTAAGVAVRVTTRNPDRAHALPAFRGAEVVAGDSSVPETLKQALTGVDKCYYVPPTHPGWDLAQAAFVQVAAAAGVRHVVKMSAMGASPSEPSMSLRFHDRGEKDLQGSRMGYTLIRPNSFSQNSLFDAASIRDLNCFYSCVGEARFAKVDTEDVGEVVARVLLEDGHVGKTYELTGPEALSYDDMAVALSTALGRAVEYVDVSADEYAELLTRSGLPAWMAVEFADIYGRGFYAAGGGSRVTTTVEELLGRPPRSYADVVHSHADAFR